MSTQNEDAKQVAEEAVKNKKKLEKLVNVLATGSRRERQHAAAAIALVAKLNPEVLAPYIDELVDALNRPEAQTRWEVLEALSDLVAIDARVCEKACQGAETALFDEDSGPLRLSAMRFLCKIGSTTENRSEKVWSLIDEGIQCYHGDLEFTDMLSAVSDFAGGKISPNVKSQLYARMRFDAENGKGGLKKRAQQIIDNLGEVEVIELDRGNISSADAETE